MSLPVCAGLDEYRSVVVGGVLVIAAMSVACAVFCAHGVKAIFDMQAGARERHDMVYEMHQGMQVLLALRHH